MGAAAAYKKEQSRDICNASWKMSTANTKIVDPFHLDFLAESRQEEQILSLAKSC